MSSKTGMSNSVVSELVGDALALGARRIPGWSPREIELIEHASNPLPFVVESYREAIRAGADPLGDTFCRAFTAEERRPNGATYTPKIIVDSMVAWAERQGAPVRVIDPGAGSGRFLVAAGRSFPQAELIAVDVDPLATIMARGHLAAAGFASRARVTLGDFRERSMRRTSGPTLYIGNPPYVRHHLIETHWKTWLTDTARRHGIEASQLAGLHAHFFLAIAEQSQPGDFGVLITASEWLDVNYGRLVRELLLDVLGVTDLHVIDPMADPFPEAQATAVITGFKVGARPQRIGLRRVATLNELRELDTDWFVRRERLEVEDRWTPLTRPGRQRREGFIELGEICRVHRGQVTGANNVWISGRNEFDLPDEVLFRSITRAKELITANGVIVSGDSLRHVIDLPPDLDYFDVPTRKRIDLFLRFAESRGANLGFVARHRKAWWAVGLRRPAPILATYMARRPPAFARNLAEVRHINIAHGLYPRETLSPAMLDGLVRYLSRSVDVADGRTYAGGLTKFEPREMERLLVPSPESFGESALWQELG